MLPKAHRLTKQKDFDYILKNGKPLFSQSFIIKIVKNNLTINRCGFIISKKISKKAVIRNKLKRQLREIIRQQLNFLKTGYDLIIIVKKNTNIINKNYQQLISEINHLLKKAYLINNL